MKKISSSVAVALSLLTLMSCGGNGSSSQEQADSLQIALLQQEDDNNQLREFLTIIASGLDSISAQESSIIDLGQESPIPNQQKIKSQLANFKQTLQQQREQIAQLEKRLKKGSKDAAMLQTLITSLKTQLSEKEARIAELEGEVASKNLTINDLTDRLGTVSRKSAQQAEIIESQGQLMKEQDATIHEVYVKIASKKQLVQSGLLTKGGLFSKKKVDYENLDRSLFDKEDDRTTTFSIPTKKAKILTQMPEDSYTIEPNGEKCTLTILDPARFWSVSKYLIIQAD